MDGQIEERSRRDKDSHGGAHVLPSFCCYEGMMAKRAVSRILNTRGGKREVHQAVVVFCQNKVQERTFKGHELPLSHYTDSAPIGYIKMMSYKVKKKSANSKVIRSC